MLLSQHGSRSADAKVLVQMHDLKCSKGHPMTARPSPKGILVHRLRELPSMRGDDLVLDARRVLRVRWRSWPRLITTDVSAIPVHKLGVTIGTTQNQKLDRPQPSFIQPLLQRLSPTTFSFWPPLFRVGVSNSYPI